MIYCFSEKDGPAAKLTPYRQELEDIESLLHEAHIKGLMGDAKPGAKISYEIAVSLDGLFRFSIRQKVKEVLNYIYNQDVYMSIAKVAIEHKYVFPVALHKSDHSVKLLADLPPIGKKCEAK